MSAAALSKAVDAYVLARPRIRSALAALAELHQLSTAPERSVLSTGFDPLDEVLGGGIRPGEVVLLGGKPGVGKTIASMQWARAMARQGVVAVYLCYEHDDVTLLSRLLTCELGDVLDASGPGGAAQRQELQARIGDVASGAITLREALESDPLLAEAHHRLAAYADRLVFVTGSGAHTDVGAIRDVVRGYEGQAISLFVDYVQKVPCFPSVPAESERVGRVIEGLKQVALDEKVPVVAIAASDHEGLNARRLHLRHFRGSTALAYEADAVVVLNDKLSIVSRAHVAYSPTRAEEFQRQVVFSVEKNRNGEADVHLEFVKDFGHYRFDPRGRWVAERLWTEGSIEQ